MNNPDNVGTATQPGGQNAQQAQGNFETFTLDPSEMTALRDARQNAGTTAQGDNFLAVLLAGGSGWNAAQIQRLTGISQQSIGGAVRAWQHGRLASLQRLAPCTYGPAA